MIGNLQVLRFLAASGVVILHSNAEVFGQHTDFYGVALFFVLSGYVMSLVHRRRPMAFFVDRVWRIVPAYWLAMALFIVVLRAWNDVSWMHIAQSALFIPHYEPVAGFFPVLGVGWTLNMEMYFYTLFAVAIALSQSLKRDIAPAIAGLLVVVVAWALPHVTSNEAVLHYYTHEYLYFFVIGIAIWYAVEWVSPRIGRLSVPKWVFPLAVPAYAALVLLGVNQFIVVTALFVVAIVTFKMRADLQVKSLLLLGAASYACYLLHTIFLSILRAKGVDISGTAIFTVFVLLVSWAIAVIWFETLERLIRRAQRRWTRRGSRTTPSAHAINREA